MKTPLLSLSLCALLAPMLHAEVKLPAIFGDNMVLQQDKPLNFWGKADPQEKVTISVAGQSGSATAGADGKWKIQLAALNGRAEPVTVKVEGKNTITLSNVLVGEVWLGSGQSNMAWNVFQCVNGEEEVAAAKHPSIRLFSIKAFGWPTPLEDVQGNWVECSPESARRFSATLYFFGRDLQKQINRPMGLINCSLGSTIVQSWSPWEVLMSDPEVAQQSQTRVKELDDPQWVANKFAEETLRYQQAKEKSKADGTPLRAGPPVWRDASFRNRPSALYNAMIHPILGFQLRGIVWYQGEFNAGESALYSRMFPNMITGWRKRWGIGEFPFLFVQLPAIGSPQAKPTGGGSWAEMREAQARTLESVANTAMAVTIDTCPEGDLHPKNKQPVGNRLALLAANLVYQKKEVACQAPAYEGIKPEGKAIRVTFRHADQGLEIKDRLQGFTIAGADKKFVRAEGRLEGQSLLLSSPEISEPVAVRYAWANNPLICLWGKNGLPVAPFRSDDWK